MLHIAVGVSGGVDSATAALMLQRQGHEVTGVFMRNWDEKDERGAGAGGSACPVEEDLKDARSVCKHIGIPLVELDFTREYWNDVFATFLDDMAQGLTSNPDVACNAHIKFKVLLKHAKAMGADVLATGHYARTADRDGQCVLLRGTDHLRDQSYFMCTVPHDALAQSLFPLGELTKEQVRAIAEDAGIHVAKKRSSVGVCFVGKKRSFGDFVAAYIDDSASVLRPGTFVDVETGNTLGVHRGIVHYTHGQRARLAGQSAPWYVVGKDVGNNRIYLCQGDAHDALFCDSAVVKDIQWIAGAAPQKFQRGEMNCQYKARYLQRASACTAMRVCADGMANLDFEASIYTHYRGSDNGGFQPSSSGRNEERDRYARAGRGGDCARISFTKRPEQSRHIKPSPSTMETCVSVGDSSHCQAVHASSCDERTKISSIQNANASDNNFFVVILCCII